MAQYARRQIIINIKGLRWLADRCLDTLNQKEMRKMKKLISILLMMLLIQGLLVCLNASAIAANVGTDQKSIPVPSSTAQKLYFSAKNDLLQLRILVRNGRAQKSVGSGFLIGTSNLVVTNYHVVSGIALEPDIYVGEFVDTHEERGPVELLAVDVLHDLAIVRISRKGNGNFNIPASTELTQGQYLYSLGNPLDLGFTISEGTYNGISKLVFYEHLMFTGAINPGMSGGPCLTVDGQLAGVNVSRASDGELASFLVPVRYVKELLKKVDPQQKPPQDFKATVGQQLLAHQVVMVNRLFDKPLTLKTLGPYQAPITELDQMRCWGQSINKQNSLLTIYQMACAMGSSLYVSDKLKTGSVSIGHQFTQSTELGALRFSEFISSLFKVEKFGSHKDRHRTGPVCTEQFLDNKKLSMRAVICVRAYRKFEDLYDFSVLTSTTDERLMNLESRLDVNGISYENGLRVSKIFLESIGREKKP